MQLVQPLYLTAIMRWFLIIFLCSAITAASQDNERNRKPEITGQREIQTDEDEPVEIQITDLYVKDPDDWWFPFGFTMQLYEGKNYTLDGNTVIPDQNFNGILTVPVTVNDGEDDSKKFDLKVDVEPINDLPVITGQSDIITQEGQPVTIRLEHLSVTDPDSDYPGDFLLIIHPSTDGRYTVSGTTVTPNFGTTGQLGVMIHVNDGLDNSLPFELIVNVLPANRPPVIVGQVDVGINEDDHYQIGFEDITVQDPDNDYPSDFAIRVLPGENYSSSENDITPQKDFFGVLAVNVVANDGTSDSEVFPFRIDVAPVNDPPVISNLEDAALEYEQQGTLIITEEIRLSDSDNETLIGATVAFQADRYLPGVDGLECVPPVPGITATFDVAQGILLLSGVASCDEYQQVLRSVRYSFRDEAGIAFQNKIIIFTASDGEAVSQPARRIIGGPEVMIDLDIPTAFTPNGDLTNDTWKITPLETYGELNDPIVRVYNRLGYLLFESSGFEREWDGRVNGQLLPSDTYFYTIDFRSPATRKTFKGVVTILR